MGPESELGGEQGRRPHDGKGLVVLVEPNASQREQSMKGRGRRSPERLRPSLWLGRSHVVGTFGTER